MNSITECRNEVAEKYRVSETTIHKWSKKFSWQDRIQRRNELEAKKTDERVTDTLAESNVRHIKEAIKLQDKGSEIIAKKAEEGNFRDGVLAIEKGITLERLIRGESTENVDSKSLVGMLSIDDAREAIRRIREERKRKETGGLEMISLV